MTTQTGGSARGTITPAQMQVANNVRAELARERWSGRKAAEALGYTQPYLQRRLNGDIPLDVNDLIAIAGLLNMPLSRFTRFFEGVATGPAAIITARPSLLPDQDSNLEPADSSPDLFDQAFRYQTDGLHLLSESLEVPLRFAMSA